MNKIIIKCPKCKNKMKIRDKIATYRCPNCKEKYSYNRYKKILEKIKRILKDGIKLIPVLIKKIKRVFQDLINIIKNKFKK